MRRQMGDEWKEWEWKEERGRKEGGINEI